MSDPPVESRSPLSLRLRAVSRLKGHTAPPGDRPEALAALSVLHGMAAHPATAPDALALLHELQVHQVELDLQDEELRRARLELEADLAHQRLLFDHAPVGLFTVDRQRRLREVNLAGAGLLGARRDESIGRVLDDFVDPRSVPALHAMLERVDQGGNAESCTLRLPTDAAALRRVHASAGADPSGEGFLIAWADRGGPAV